MEIMRLVAATQATIGMVVTRGNVASRMRSGITATEDMVTRATVDTHSKISQQKARNMVPKRRIARARKEMLRAVAAT